MKSEHAACAKTGASKLAARIEIFFFILSDAFWEWAHADGARAGQSFSSLRHDLTRAEPPFMTPATSTIRCRLSYPFGPLRKSDIARDTLSHQLDLKQFSKHSGHREKSRVA
jgi:hypothetical protein